MKEFKLLNLVNGFKSRFQRLSDTIYRSQLRYIVVNRETSSSIARYRRQTRDIAVRHEISSSLERYCRLT